MCMSDISPRGDVERGVSWFMGRMSAPSVPLEQKVGQGKKKYSKRVFLWFASEKHPYSRGALKHLLMFKHMLKSC